MIGLDTNVLVRYIVQDDPEQADAAARLIEGQCTERSPGHLSPAGGQWLGEPFEDAEQGTVRPNRGPKVGPPCASLARSANASLARRRSTDAVRYYYPTTQFDPNAGVKVAVIDTGIGPHGDLNIKGATPEALARALLRPKRRADAKRPEKRSREWRDGKHAQ